MLISQRASSSGLIGAPRPGALRVSTGCMLQAASDNAARATIRLDIDIRHAPVLGHAPAHNRMVVKDVGGGILCEPVLARRLHTSPLIGRPSLQDRRLAGPLPGQAKAHQAFW